MKTVKITIIADIEDKDWDTIKRMEHHAEGIFSEYPELDNPHVVVKDVTNGYNEEDDDDLEEDDDE